MEKNVSAPSILPFAAILAGLSVMGAGCSRASAQAGIAPERRIKLTIYKDDFALVRESRPIALRAGRNQVTLSDVSRSLDPNSILLDFGSADMQVLSTTYDLGAEAGTPMISRFAGREVDLMLPSNDGSPGNTIHGRLEPGRGDEFLLRTDDKLYVNPAGTIVAPAAADVSTMPRLSAEIDAKAGGKGAADLGYLTRGMSWTADYTGRLDLASSTLRLDCWATVTNKTGIPYPSADISFMAGSPNRAVTVVDGAMIESREQDAEMKVPVVATPVAVGELYAYRAPAPASIGIDQMNRVPMFKPASVPVKLDYSLALPSLSSWSPAGQSSPRLEAQLGFSFLNQKNAGLGFPLPAGAIRVYGTEGDSAYLGAGEIMDTPDQAKVDLMLSKVFDVSAEQKVIKYIALNKKTVRKTVQVVVRNAKSNAVTVRIVQSPEAGFKLASATAKPTVTSSAVLEWSLTVPSGGSKTITFSVDLAR